MIYKFVAYNDKGEIVKGRLPVANEEAATQMLSYASYHAISLKPYKPFFSLDKLAGSLFPIKTTDIVIFYRQLAELLEAGTGMVGSLELLQEQANNRQLKKILGDVILDVSNGGQLSKAFSKFPKIFPKVDTELMAVGEHTGNFETVLRQIADHIEREHNIKKETKNALKLPAITLLVAFAVLSIMVMFVVPTFGDFYDMLGQDLPFMAQMLMDISDIALSYGIYALLALLAFGGLFALYIRKPSGRYKLDKFILSLPKVGHVIHLRILSRCCRSMSLLFHAGVPLTEAMPVVIQGSGNQVIAEALMNVEEEMLKGQGLSKPMSENKLFLPMMVQMIRVGEEAGTMSTMLNTVAQSYEVEADEKMRSLVALIQPAITLLLGLVVGVIAVSMVQTLYGMDLGV